MPITEFVSLTIEIGEREWERVIRFMQQFETGQGDYSIDRHQRLDKYTVDDIAKMVREKKGPYKIR